MIRHALPGLCLAFAGLSAATAAPAAGNADEAFAALEREYAVYFLGHYPVVATYLGGAAVDPSLADVDGRLRDFSPAAIEREDAEFRRLRGAFAVLDPAKLSARRRIDREVALAQLDFLLRQHGIRRQQERSIDAYMDEPFRGVDWHLQGLAARDDGDPLHYGSDADWRRLVARVRAVPAYLKVAQGQLLTGIRRGNTPDWRMVRANGLDAALGNVEYFRKSLPAIGAERIGGPERETLLKDLAAASNAAADAYQAMADFIRRTWFADPALAGAAALKPAYRADHFAAGEVEYDWAMRNNLGLQTTAARLYEEAWPIVEATRSKLPPLAREIAGRHGWSLPADDEAAVRAVFAKLGEDAPRSDDELLEDYRRVGARLVDYARRTGLFEVPADYRLAVVPTPPPLLASTDGAAYYPAPPLKGTGVGNFFVSPTGNDPAALAAQNRASMADLAAHEGFPGHDWHYKVMTEYRDGISLVRWLTPGAVEDSSSMWQDSMAAEGWALYAEALMAEPQPAAPQGFYSPEERLYQLRGLLYRDLRVRIDTGIHTGRMRFDEAVDLFSQVVDFFPGSCREPAAIADAAKRESCKGAWNAVFRYSRWPTQAITYRLGKDQILALRAEAAQRLGQRFDARRFHVEFMKQGTIPAGYFREELLRALEAAAPAP